MNEPSAPRLVPMRRTRVAIAGASGFVGRALLAALQQECDVVALTRRPPVAGDAGGNSREGPRRDADTSLTWRRCDLFSLGELERALRDVDAAFYLVHSMMPSARLTQGRFEDLDLLLADNFGRAAAACGLERIVYLGGLVPARGTVSPHLRSRVEVEEALGAHGVPVTALRAGLVVGAGGSSVRILLRLVGRLPVMVCPAWTTTRTQPIALDDVVTLLRHALRDAEARGRVCEVGGPDVMTYRQMMQETARVLGVRRWMLPVPLFSPRLSRLWVVLVTGTPSALVGPLVESLRHPMLAEDRWLQRRIGLEGRRFAVALAEAASESAPTALAASGRRARRSHRRALAPTARSVQRLPLPPGWDAEKVAQEYTVWLPRFLWPFLRVESDGVVCRFHVRGLRRALLELTFQPERSSADRAVFLVTGGRLAAPGGARPGRLEFRSTPGGDQVIAAVHDFRPRLPWYIYNASQALVHLWVMRGFGGHLARLVRGPGASLPQRALPPG